MIVIIIALSLPFLTVLSYFICVFIFTNSLILFKTGLTYDNDNDLGSWKELARDIQHELHTLGRETYEKKLVELFTTFGYKMIQDGPTSPRTYNDVFSIMADQTWYNDNIEHKRSLCYYIAYRIFRASHNKWAKDIAGE